MVLISGNEMEVNKAYRQKNMDYCVCKLLKHNTEGLWQVVLYYDIMCQYWVNVRQRFSANPFLSFPEGLEKIS